MVKRRLYKTQSWLEISVVLVVLVLLNILSGFYYKRFDLTKEKRYTLSETSKNLAGKLTESLYLKIYLEGEMSGHFKQLKNEIRDLAYEFREASGNKIEIELLNPIAGIAGKERAQILEEFARKGMEPVRDINTGDEEETTIRYLIPAAEFNYKGKSIPASLFQFDVALSIEDNIQRAIENIEYEMANALRQCVLDKQKRIIVATGNGEMTDARVGSFARELQKYYSVEAVNLNVSDPAAGAPFLELMQAKPDSAEIVLMNALQRRLNLSDLLLVIKPLKDYSPAELFLIDQFLLKGGKVMWLIDPVNIEIDSFQRNETFVAFDNGLENINASLFNYGVAFNSDLLQDATCNQVPIPVGGRYELTNFFYFPLFTSYGQTHIITKNLGPVWCQFPSTLKLKSRPELNTVPLLSSSPRTKISHAPATVELMNIYIQNQDRNYVKNMKAGIQNSGALLEGKFHSAFANQKKYTKLKFLPEGTSKMIVIADGDVIRNQVSGRGGNFPTGYDRFTQVTFSNKKFLLNCIDYLIDDNGLIEIRGKELGLRLLDKTRIKEEKTFWQNTNVVLPNVLIIVFGLINFWIRRRKYAVKSA